VRRHHVRRPPALNAQLASRQVGRPPRRLLVQAAGCGSNPDAEILAASHVKGTAMHPDHTYVEMLVRERMNDRMREAAAARERRVGRTGRGRAGRAARNALARLRPRPACPQSRFTSRCPRPPRGIDLCNDVMERTSGGTVPRRRHVAGVTSSAPSSQVWPPVDLSRAPPVLAAPWRGQPVQTTRCRSRAARHARPT
jgi:hypothetical protein